MLFTVSVTWLVTISGPMEVIQEIRKRNIPTIAGNYDFGIGRAIDDCGCAYKTDQEKANGAISISFTNEMVGERTQVPANAPCPYPGRIPVEQR